MGSSEADAVDTQLRVRGVRGVRVADASAIPVTPVSALNAPSMLIGYRCAKMIAARDWRADDRASATGGADSSCSA